MAWQTPEGWRLSGRKIHATGAPILRWYAVWARTDEAAPRVGTFLVRADSPGVRVEPTWACPRRRTTHWACSPPARGPRRTALSRPR
ncbi:acyl-CoA dehydrogenase family protein [Alicycliphilus denitrificans]|uniref:acyl-CoA dehydrogenase family protein n=1 Tax=Alicycliphilus denitrificans TaxID=179636 RepID=UPI001EE689D8|nr:acyl-CoA dehydrogenase family protein [Alicycliphilus denitrificans]